MAATTDLLWTDRPPVSAPARPPRRVRLLRGRADDPVWVRPALLGLLLATALLYLVGLGSAGWANDFYAAAAQAASASWKAWFFGSFDASNFITVDKTPASLWVMGLSARLFGVNSWSLLVPQALEGVAAVGLLYAAVRRWFGPAAGLLAGAVFALTPAATLMFRFDNPDALLVLLLVAAAYATGRAIEDGRTRWLVVAGTLVGFGFLTKMLQALLVLPALALAYLVAGPPALGRRLVQLVAGDVATLVGGGWWVAIVELLPASARPYVGGSQTNSVLQLTFGYNGFGRITGNETGSVGFGNGRGPQFGGGPSLARLFGAEMGGQVSWLLPAALVALVGLAAISWRAGRTDRRRAAALLWGGWLAVTGGVFSFMAGIIHPYYTIALAPAIGALVGVGAVAAWRLRERLLGRGLLAAMIAVSTVWSYVLLGRTPAWHPQLRAAVVAAGLLGTALALAGPGLRRVGLAARGRQVLAVTIGAGLMAGLAGPAAYSLSTAGTAHRGAIPSAGPAVAAATGRPASLRGFAPFGGQNGPPAGFAPPVGGPPVGGPPVGGPPVGGLGGGGLGGDTAVSGALTSLLRSGASGYRWTAAAVGSLTAAPLQLASGKAIMAIGGFNGTDPTPTLAEFQRMVASHEIHYFVASDGRGFGGSGDTASAIANWVAQHFTSTQVGGRTVYDLSAG